MKQRSFIASLFLPLTSILIAVAILWGNIVVRSGAGLACPDWPLCHGRLIPPMRLDVLLEYTHRWLALLLTLSALAAAWLVYRQYPPFYKKVMSFVLSLLLVEILLGGLTVLLKLPSPVIVAHFAISLLILIAFLLMTFAAYQDLESASLRQPYLWLLLLFYIQSVTGAFVRHTAAGLACGVEFPTCLGKLFPPLHSLPLIFHLLHRWFAVLVLLAFLGATFILSRQGQSKAARLLLYCLGLQIFLGAATVLSRLQIAVATLHLANALLLITLIVYFSVSETGADR